MNVATPTTALAKPAVPTTASSPIVADLNSAIASLDMAGHAADETLRAPALSAALEPAGRAALALDDITSPSIEQLVAKSAAVEGAAQILAGQRLVTTGFDAADGAGSLEAYADAARTDLTSAVAALTGANPQPDLLL